ncbi:MAG TPA: long-chain fatty acid--CoA ligase, partial [Rhodospirillales bacterium]|nr:long-chain fatty acid--CoA ligase [Rhodospirillales bacterium]
MREDTPNAQHPWTPRYPKNVDWAKPFPAHPLFDLLDQSVAKFPGNPCIDFLGKTWTYGEVGDLVDRAAAGFKRLGVAKGVKVGLCLPNTPYFVICYFAVLKAGGTVVNYNPLYAKREMARQIEDSETAIMVTLDLRQIYRKVAPMLEETALEKIVVCPMGDILPMLKSVLFTVFKRSKVAGIPSDSRHSTFAELTACAGKAEPASIDPEKDIAVLQYTGGTTGKPKGAMLTHANLAANALQVRRWFHSAEAKGVKVGGMEAGGMEEGAERILGALPLFHVFAMTMVMNLGIAGGALLILLPRFQIKQVLETING